MKVAVVGSRSWTNPHLVNHTLDELENVELIISGGAAGADTFGAIYAKAHGIELKVFYPDWQKHGRSAGFKRNVDIVAAADLVLAFWDGQSKGTKHDIDLARRAGKQLIIVYPTGKRGE